MGYLAGVQIILANSSLNGNILGKLDLEERQIRKEERVQTKAMLNEKHLHEQTEMTVGLLELLQGLYKAKPLCTGNNATETKRKGIYFQAPQHFLSPTDKTVP